MINDEIKDKIKIMERLHIAEMRNTELENTIKTLNARIEISATTTNVNNTNKHNDNASDDLVIGIRDRVTKIVLNKIDNELNKMENNDRSNETETKNYDYEQFSAHNQNQQYMTTNGLNYNYGHHWNYYPQYHYENETVYSQQNSVCVDNLVQINPEPTNQNVKKTVSESGQSGRIMPNQNKQCPKTSVNRASSNTKYSSNDNRSQPNPKTVVQQAGQPLFYRANVHEHQMNFLPQRSLHNHFM